jgi:hypothetical protein
VLAVPGHDTAGDGAPGPASPPALADATVYSTQPDPSAPGTTVVTVLVPAGQAGVLAAYGSAGLVAVVGIAR